MTEPISIRRITPELHPVARRLWQLYAHDLSQQRGTWPEPDGLYADGRLPAYRKDPAAGAT